MKSVDLPYRGTTPKAKTKVGHESQVIGARGDCECGLPRTSKNLEEDIEPPTRYEVKFESILLTIQGVTQITSR